MSVNIAACGVMGLAETKSASDVMASALRWWHDAGVDTAIDEVPRQWLAPVTQMPERREKAPLAPVAPAIPVNLSALVDWLMTSPDIADAGPPSRRVGPSGDPASGVMILTDCPDLADTDEGRLLGGAVAELFDKMLAAIGQDRARSYLASISPGRPPSGRLDASALAALTPTARRHVVLAAPKKLWLLGDAASRAILGMSDRDGHGRLHHINLDGVMIDAVVTAHPRYLRTRADKARAWDDMQRLIVKETE